METLLKADIFFTITSVAVILIALAAIVALIYVILILNELRHLMRRIREEGESIVDDFSAIREVIERQGWRTKEVIDALGRGALSLVRMMFRSGKDRREDE